MDESHTPLPDNLKNPPPSGGIGEKIETFISTKSDSFFRNTLIEGIIVFVLLAGGLCVELANRQILILNGALNISLIQLVLQRAFAVTVLCILGYRALKTGIIFATTFFSITRLKTQTHMSKIARILNDSFITLATILISIPVRPILQETITTGSPYLSQAFVRYDAIASIIILCIPALPLLYFVQKEKHRFEKGLHIGLIVSSIGIVGFFNSQSNFDARVFESRAQWVTQNWGKQESDAQEALSDAKTDEERAIAYYWLGVANNRQSNYTKAIEYQLKALALDPEYAAAHASLANGYLFTNQPEKAFDHAKKCVKYRPEYAWCYSSLANYFGQMGEIDTAIQYAQRATKLDPNNTDLQRQLQSLTEFKAKNQ